MTETFLLIAYLGFATSATSVTLTRAKISEGFRAWLKERSDFTGKLINCPYCTSHWVAGILVILYQPTTGHAFLFVDWCVAIMAIVGIAAIVTGVVTSTIPTLKEK